MAHEVTFIPGDGTGPELAEATRRVLEATGVEFDWDEHPAGEDVYHEEGNAVPRSHPGVDQAHRGRHQGPDHDAGRLGLSLGQRAAAQGARPLRLHPPVQGLRGRAHALPRDRHRDRAREHRGPLRGHRVRARQPGERRSCASSWSTSSARQVREDAGHLDQADLASSAPSASSRPPSTTREANGRQQGDGRAQGEHHEVLRRAVPRGRAQGGRGLPRHRVRGPHHRQPVQPARVAPGGVRRDRAAQPLRRHRLRPRRRADRRPGPRARRQHRHRGGDVRGHPRLGAQVQGAEQGEPDGADALRRADAAPPRRARRGRPPGGARSRR